MVATWTPGGAARVVASCSALASARLVSAACRPVEVPGSSTARWVAVAGSPNATRSVGGSSAVNDHTLRSSVVSSPAAASTSRDSRSRSSSAVGCRSTTVERRSTTQVSTQRASRPTSSSGTSATRAPIPPIQRRSRSRCTGSRHAAGRRGTAARASRSSSRSDRSAWAGGVVGGRPAARGCPAPRTSSPARSGVASASRSAAATLRTQPSSSRMRSARCRSRPTVGATCTTVVGLRRWCRTASRSSARATCWRANACPGAPAASRSSSSGSAPTITVVLPRSRRRGQRAGR